MNLRLVGYCAWVVVSTFSTAGAADDLIRARLDKSKAAFEESVKKYRAAVAASLDAREEAARKNGDKKLVDQVKEDRQAFVERGEVPGSLPPLVKAQLAAARARLEGDYNAAIREYTKAKQDDAAAAVEKELALFRKAAGAEPRLDEVLAKGAVLAGRKKNDPSSATPKGTDEPFQLKVVERTGAAFKGEILIDGQRTYAVSGEITGDRVSFASEKKDNDRFHQSYKGTLKGGQLDLTFSGVYGSGTAVVDVKGKATLAPTRK